MTQIPKKVFIRTFGCQMNAYDSAKMLDVLNADSPSVLTDQPDEADVILFNTCSVREKAQEKVFSDLGRARELKRGKPSLVIGVGGCVASQEGAAIIARAPYVDVVFGPQTLHRLPALIQARAATGKPQVDIRFPEIEKFDHLPPPRVSGPTAFVSIMEGCSKYCSFCVVPYTRGEEVSRPLDDVLTEIADLADQGVCEVTLLGQNVNAYRGLMTPGEMADFALLLEYVHDIPGIKRIRFTTSHPKEMSTRLIQAYGQLPKLVSFLHLPVQSGSDRILAAMKRGYTALEYKSIIRRLREQRPDIGFSSDFIIGFPGETDADFEATLQLIDSIGFDQSFSFVYSRRPGTPAADLSDDTPAADKAARLAKLQARIVQLADAIGESMVGSVQPVLIEGRARNLPDRLMGRTPNNRPVHVFGPDDWTGQIIDVRINRAQRSALQGEALQSASTPGKLSI